MWPWVPLNLVLVLCFALNDMSEARQMSRAAVVVGTVYCDTCFHQDFFKSSHFISGALVAVGCDGGQASTTKPSFWEKVRTNEKGEFSVKLPYSVGKHVHKIKGCSVKLISSYDPHCAIGSTATSSSISLKAKRPGTHIFSAGFFTFKPLQQPQLCNQDPRIKNSKAMNSLNVPPLVPNLTGIPIPGVTSKTETTSESDDLANEDAFDFPFPPDPFRPPSLTQPDLFQPPPASIFPPNPFQPPPAFTLPTNPFQPAPPSLIPQLTPSPPPAFMLPPFSFPPQAPLPGMIPSPPTPPMSPLPMPPFPPFPFQPSPGFPGTPPALSSAPLKKLLQLGFILFVTMLDMSLS